MKKVLCHGCWDVLHYGHIKHLRAAKKWGDHLTVSVTADRFVNKGPGRPYFAAEQRAEMLRNISFVDEVVISDYPTAINVISSIRPAYYVKGSDYRDLSKDVTGEIYNEIKETEKYGGQLVFTDEETFSSSTIINKFFQGWTDEQRAAIDRVKSLGGIEAIRKALDEITKLKILVVGEPILDVYRFVQPEGISSKSPSISCRYLYEEEYQGGSIAILNHLLGFAEHCVLQPGATQKKIRYISGQQRVFEVTEIQETKNKVFIADKLLERAKKTDVVVLADFGHGLFEGEVLDACKEIKAFTGLNVQTNSSNFGYNVFQKHQRFEYLCLDTREARLATHDRYSDPLVVANKVKEIVQRPFGFTVGSNGAYLLDDKTFYSPAFSDVVIDATGAGDAYFAITTVLLATECDRDLIPFIGNVFAGLKTKIIGNKSAVSKAALLKACNGVLA